MEKEAGQKSRHQHRMCTGEEVRRRMLAISVALYLNPLASVEIAILIIPQNKGGRYFSGNISNHA
jgi:hypothetical protein